MFFGAILLFITGQWVMMSLVLRESQNRSLAPEHYTLQIVTAEYYRRLADPANRQVELADGTKYIKAPIWDELVLPNYKPTDDGRFYVLVRTNGTAHYLPQVTQDFLLIGILAACGLAASIWNLRRRIEDLAPVLR